MISPVYTTWLLCQGLASNPHFLLRKKVDELSKGCSLCSVISLFATANHKLFLLHFVRCGSVTSNLFFAHTLESQKIMLSDRVLKDIPSPFFYTQVGLAILTSHLRHLSSLLLKSTSTGKPAPFSGDPAAPHCY